MIEKSFTNELFKQSDYGFNKRANQNRLSIGSV